MSACVLINHWYCVVPSVVGRCEVSGLGSLASTRLIVLEGLGNETTPSYKQMMIGCRSWITC